MITIVQNHAKVKIDRIEGESVMETLIRNGYMTSAVCGGQGRCGKCRVQFLEKAPEPLPAEKLLFSVDELKNGWRLSCLTSGDEDITIRIHQENEEQFEVIDSFSLQEDAQGESDIVCPETGYQAAIDIGTTTLAFVLKNGKSVIAKTAGINHQRMYGADVISRIQASVDGKKEHLKQLIRKDLYEGICRLSGQARIEVSQIEKIMISGNTTMGHLLMGYDCNTLGIVPFTPVNIDYISGSAEELIEEILDAEVLLLPGISTFVGADIVSGLYACGFDHTDEICLLIDLGTNGEMALGNREKILVTSTAAGPVFEGGNIKWGTGSIEGAINSVEITEEGAVISTIGNQPPVGICGTGVIETAAGLFEWEYMDENGKLEDPYFEDGYPIAETPDGTAICLTQKDIREIQLAKSAIRAGMETLLLRYGIEKDAVSRVFIAGGFGFRLNLEKAVLIGLIPKEFIDRTETVGNSSLAGASFALEDPLSEDKIRHILSVSTEIPLSGDKDFNRLYMEYMFFGDDDY